jgi:predicted kinase
MIECRADPEIVKQRLDQRQGDASDADWATFLKLREEWEAPGELWQNRHLVIDTGATAEKALHQALSLLQEHQLWESKSLG